VTTTNERRMTARFPGYCSSCCGPIRKGAAIIHAGRGNTRHADCDAAPAARAFDPFARTASRGYYGRDRARCEDAPCCGCC
jgi:hypothetical protein